MLLALVSAPLPLVLLAEAAACVGLCSPNGKAWSEALERILSADGADKLVSGLGHALSAVRLRMNHISPLSPLPSPSSRADC